MSELDDLARAVGSDGHRDHKALSPNSRAMSAFLVTLAVGALGLLAFYVMARQRPTAPAANAPPVFTVPDKLSGHFALMAVVQTVEPDRVENLSHDGVVWRRNLTYSKQQIEIALIRVPDTNEWRVADMAIDLGRGKQIDGLRASARFDSR